MITTIIAHTEEIDDVDFAVNEILEQLDFGDLKRNSVGIVCCFTDFLDSGVVDALGKALPFPIVGSTTLGTAIGSFMSTTSLTCMVLTSDDVQFSVGLSEPIDSGKLSDLKPAYESAAARLSGKPSLIIAFAPLLVGATGDFFVNSFNELSGGVPLFGAIAVDHYNDYHAAQVIFGGETYYDRTGFILMSGPAEPRFFIASIAEEVLFRDKAVVTDFEGNLLRSVNNMPVTDYLMSIGLQKNENNIIEGINAFPFLIDYGDGTPSVVRVLFDLTPEGYAVCAGDIPIGSTITVCSIDAQKVLETTAQFIDEVTHCGKEHGALLFSCIGRYFAQGLDTTAELRLVTGSDWSKLPYVLFYSGGELCPVYGKDGHIANRNHNDTLIGCIF